MDLLLTTPEQHDYQDPTLDLDERHLNERLDGLPVLDLVASLQTLVRELKPLNEQRLDMQRRLRLLGIYRTHARRLYDTAAPLQLRKLPLAQAQRQEAVDGVEALCLAMANGFKIVVKELCNDPGLPEKLDLFGRVLRWAVIQLGVALLHSYRYYRPQPDRVFLELNQLYLLARHHGLHNRTFTDGTSALKTSLAGIYQALCMLAMTDPFSAAEGQVDQRFAVLLRYAPRARIVPGNTWQGIPEGRYFIDLQSDSPPRHCVFLESPVAAREAYLLDARPALEQMHHRLAGMAREKLQQCPEVAILRYLLPEVTPRDNRRNVRRADGRWIEVVPGLEAIHRMLLEQQEGKAVTGIRWRIQDASDSGYRLAWGESAASALQVGDLLCLVAKSGNEQPLCQLLVVRWIRDERDKGTELGVEVFEGVPAPVQLVAEQRPAASGDLALFMSSHGTGKAAHLFASSGLYAEQRRLTIVAGERRVSVCCGRRIEQAPGFDCFEFTSAG